MWKCFLWTLITSGNILISSGSEFPEYSYRNHPLWSYIPFSLSPPKPVILRRYSFYHNGEPLLNRMLFAPRSASFDTLPERKRFATNIDVLVTPSVQLDGTNKKKFLEVQLNGHATVIVLLACRGLSVDELSGSWKLRNAPTEWGFPFGVVNADKNATVLGDHSRWGKNLFTVPQVAVAVEVPVPSSLEIILPHPSTLKVAGLPVLVYTLLFGQPETTQTLVAFPYPTLPKPFVAFDSDAPQANQNVVPDQDPPVPNKTCPNWLHDLHVTFSSSEKNNKVWKEPKAWRTWHPPVDPIYWCYYTHEHGSYPGHYLPKFGYTAWITPDKAEKKGFQQEPHNGFKIYSLALPEDGRIAVITVHQLLSTSRRFRTRHHSVNLAVFKVEKEGEWELDMEVFLKMDFGVPEVTFANKTTVPVGAIGSVVFEELQAANKSAGRRFNVLNIDEGFPKTVDVQYLLKGSIRDGKAALQRGVYEQWHGPLNTCSFSSASVNRGIRFDVRDAATAMRTPFSVDNGEIQELTGKSTNRIVVIPPEGFIISPAYCNFALNQSDDTNIELQQNDIFYTDPYFTTVYGKSGRYLARQFVSDTFDEVSFPPGQYTPVSPWYGHLKLEGKSARRRFLDIERATIAFQN